MARSILHMLTPLRHMSPFDVNMAVDAGFETIDDLYRGHLPDVVSLTQDFHLLPLAAGRHPHGHLHRRQERRGRPRHGGPGEEGLRAALRETTSSPIRRARSPPARPWWPRSPARCAEKFGTDLKGKRIVIFGGAGVVAYVAAVIGALEGAKTVLVAMTARERVSKIAFTMKWRFGVEVGAVDGTAPADRRKAIRDADVILSAGPAGIPILTAEDLSCAPNLLVASDVNAVPPAGIAGST